MTRSPPLLLITAAGLLLLANASAAHAGGPAVCNAKHKRPANPYGSVLAMGLKPAVASATATSPPSVHAPAGGPAKAVETPAKPLAVSRAELRASMAPCGDPA